MARVYKGGRKRKAGDRYECGQLMPETQDHGTLEQQLKRDVAAGMRSVSEVSILTAATDKLTSAGLSVSSIKVAAIRRKVLDEGILTPQEIAALSSFQKSSPISTGTEAVDILLARGIIDRDQFEVCLEFTACWCALNGKPWPKGWQAERQSPDYDGGLSERKLMQMKVFYANCLAAMAAINLTIYPLVRDVVIHGKMSGLVESILRFDIVRQNFDGGGLVARPYGVVPPLLRAKIGLLTRGIAIIADAPRADYTREALAITEKLRVAEGC
jgi:hypothetical protein